MSGKVRHIDYYPDEFIAGVGGKLSAADLGVYWMICSLVYSHGGPIDDDHVWLARLFADTHWRTVRSAIDRLVSTGKVERIGGAERVQITVRRCARELQKALTRSSQASHNGRKGGRPLNENRDLEEPEAFGDGKLTTNHQPPTTNRTNRAREVEFSETFWPKYPNKVGKPKALTAFIAARNRAELAAIMAGLDRYIREKPPDRQWMNPSTFLNQDRWSDQPATSLLPLSKPALNGNGKVELNEFGERIDWAKRADYYRRRGEWPERWGLLADVPAEYSALFADIPAKKSGTAA